MNREPLVTVYIPSRNYGKFLSQSVQSVINQTYNNWELFIIDDASNDNTESIASKYLKEYPDKIKFIKLKKKKGLQFIANKVLHLSLGSLILRLDADDWLDESALLIMVHKFLSDKNIGLVYGNYFYTNSSGKILGIEKKFINNNNVDVNVKFAPPHGACTMVKTKILKSVGGYSENFNAQDGWDLWYKVHKKIKFSNTESVIFYYRQHEDSLSKNTKKIIEARKKIISKSINSFSGNYKNKCLAIIPVKESFKNFKNAPFKKLNGKTLLDICINEVKKSKKITHIMVSTASKKVINYIKSYNSKKNNKKILIYDRSKNNEDNHIQIKRIITDSLNEFYKQKKIYPDISVFLSLHSPNKSFTTIDNAIDTLKENLFDSVVSVTPEEEPIFNLTNTGLKVLNPGRFDDLSYEKEQLYKFNGSVIAMWSNTIEDFDVLGEKIGFIEMTREDSIQIKSPNEFNLFNRKK